MNESVELTMLVEELRALESETFEIRDYTDAHDMLLPPVCSTTSSTTSCTSCSS
jgi:thiazolylpeptide-type bacteriocin precursor